MSYKKTNESQQPIKRKENNSKTQWELKVWTTNQPKARENAGDQIGIAFSFASDWLRVWREFPNPITEQRKGQPMQSRIAFDTHLKIALTEYWSGGEEKEAISNSNKKSVGRGIFIK